MPVTVTLPPDVEGWAVPAGYTGPAEVVCRNGDSVDIRWIGGPGDGETEPVPTEYIRSPMRPVPPPNHTAQLTELIVRQLAALRLPSAMRGAERVAALRVRHRLDLWQPGDPLPRGTQALWLRLRGIDAPGAMPGLCAALRGRRCCPPHAAYAPDGWAAFIEEEAAKAAKDAQ